MNLIPKSTFFNTYLNPKKNKDNTTPNVNIIHREKKIFNISIWKII